jgi:16S rRNA (guanine(1405)-N(7))-methyltransferase
LETVENLISQASIGTTDLRGIEKIVRQKMHTIIAPYLGDPDYDKAEKDLTNAYKNNDPQEMEQFCLNILSTHASTRERVPILRDFYEQLFHHTGTPEVILDLACGLNPFSLPWMGLPLTTKYYAYDLNEPRLSLINHFFLAIKHQPLTYKQDVLVSPPKVKAEVAFFFKEAHRFEDRQRGCNRAFWQAVQARHLLISLPTVNLNGNHSLIDQQRRLVARTVDGLNWKVIEILFQNEIVFCIEKES